MALSPDLAVGDKPKYSSNAANDSTPRELRTDTPRGQPLPHARRRGARRSGTETPDVSRDGDAPRRRKPAGSRCIRLRVLRQPDRARVPARLDPRDRRDGRTAGRPRRRDDRLRSGSPAAPAGTSTGPLRRAAPPRVPFGPLASAARLPEHVRGAVSVPFFEPLVLRRR